MKPLYWARVDGATLFASEICAFDVEHRGAVEEFPPGFRWTPAAGPAPLPRAARRGRRAHLARRDAGADSRHPRDRGAPPDDGRRAGRSLPLGRPRLQPGGRDHGRARGRLGGSGALLRRRHRRVLRPGRGPPGGRAPGARAPRAGLRRRRGGRRPARRGAVHRVVRAVAGAQRRAQLPAGRADGAHREGGAHRRGRRRAVRGLRPLPRRRHRRPARRAGAQHLVPAQPQPAALRPGDDGVRARGAGAVPPTATWSTWPRGYRSTGRCPASSAARRRCCARRSPGGCPTTSCGGPRSSSATAAAPPT